MNESEYIRMRECEDALWWYRALHRFLLSLTPTAINEHSMCALDVGCGTGSFASKLQERGYWVAGIDWSPLAARETKARKLDAVVVGSSNMLPYESEYFDLVTCIDVLECEGADPNKTISESLRVLKTGGHGIFLMPAHKWLLSEHDKAIHSVRRYTLSELKSMFQDKNISIVNATYLYFLLFPLMALWKVLKKGNSTSRQEAVSDVVLPNRYVNILLYKICCIEIALLKNFNLPMGMSACVVVRKDA